MQPPLAEMRPESNGAEVSFFFSSRRLHTSLVGDWSSDVCSSDLVEPPEIIELGNELRAAEAAELREVLRVLRDLTDLLRPHHATIAAAWEMCIAFDDLCARARYAVQVNGFVPEIDGHLKIRDGRHPLIDHAVPFNLELMPDEFTVLVSGPNTGGKTVLIKAVGLLVLLTQSGIVPSIGPHSSLPVFTEVFADIGDRQSIAASLSTFSAHVAVLRQILDGAGAGSLVLLDEIGSGTDPAEGGALAAATLKTLTRRREITLATTHLGALKQLAAETVGIVNASLQCDAETLTPTYRLLKGVPGRSDGLAIARRLGVADDVLAEAERAVPDAERALDALLATVETRQRELEAREREAAARAESLGQEAETLAARAGLVADREAAVRSRERELDAAARRDARAYLLAARQTVEEALARARAAVDETTAKAARRLVEEAIEQTKEGRSDGRTVGRNDLQVGDRVRAGKSAIGVIVEMREDGNAVVEIGNVRLVSATAALEVVPGATLSPSDRPSVRPSDFPAASSEISLRGLRADEAEAELTRAIDAAVLADLPYLRVIHGKGTGALRALVQAACERDPRVRRFGFAPSNQGGAGVTVIEFRA